MTRSSDNLMHRFKSSKVQTINLVLLVSLITFELLNPLNLEPIFAQAPFYQGKTVRIFVGYLSGDTTICCSRLCINGSTSRHPEIIVQNMPGAGSMIAANHVTILPNPTV
jgi:hypothetical protein